MALNEIYKDGNELALPVDESTASGDLVQVGSGIIGVAQQNAIQGEDGNWYTTVKSNGVFKLLGDGLLTVGDNAYFNNGSVSSDSNDGKFVGHVVAVIEADQHVYVRLVQAA